MIEINFNCGKMPDTGINTIVFVVTHQMAVDRVGCFWPEKEAVLLKNKFKKVFFDEKKSGFCDFELANKRIIGLKIDNTQDEAGIQKSGEILAEMLSADEKAVVYFLTVDRETSLAVHLAFGVELGAYYWQQKAGFVYPELEKVIFSVTDAAECIRNYRPWAALANAIRYGRDLMNENASDFTAEMWAADCQRLQYLGLEIAAEIYDGRYEVLISWKGNPSQKEAATVLLGTASVSGNRTGAAAVTALMKALALQKFPKNVIAAIVLEQDREIGISKILCIKEKAEKQFGPEETIVVADFGCAGKSLWCQNKNLRKVLLASASVCGENLQDGRAEDFPAELQSDRKNAYINCGTVNFKNQEADIFGVKLLNHFMRARK